ncbi:MAG: hypothetical protein JNL32_08545, partial [Candidatus Kapabacteria bacterium]|nr:hypothetical protein [Candidatus Kapabacteria bacterium]
MKNSASVSEKNKERGIGQFIVYAVLAASVIAASVKWKSRFTASSIVFKGNTSVTESDLRAYIKQDTSIQQNQQYDLSTLRSLVLHHPLVQDANVVHTDNETVVITIKERQPAALIASNNGRLRYVDAQYVMIPYEAVRRHADVPIVYGISNDTSNCDTILLKQVMEAFIVNADGQIPSFSGDVSEIRVENQTVTLVTADEHIRIRCGRLDNLS